MKIQSNSPLLCRTANNGLQTEQRNTATTTTRKSTTQCPHRSRQRPLPCTHAFLRKFRAFADITQTTIHSLFTERTSYQNWCAAVISQHSIPALVHHYSWTHGGPYQASHPECTVSGIIHTVLNPPRSAELRMQKFKVPSDENTELKGSPFKACSRSVLLPRMLRLLPGISSWLISTLPVHSSALFPKPLPSFSCVGCG